LCGREIPNSRAKIRNTPLYRNQLTPGTINVGENRAPPIKRRPLETQTQTQRPEKRKKVASRFDECAWSQRADFGSGGTGHRQERRKKKK